jgi:hypothetical protein
MRFNDVDEVSRQHFMRKQWLTELMIQFIDDMGNPSNRKFNNKRLSFTTRSHELHPQHGI